MCLVQCLDTLGLLHQLLRCWYDDDHVHSRVGMMVLIGDVVNVFGRAEATAFQIRSVLRLLSVYGDIVQAGGAAAGACRQAYRVAGLQIADGKGTR